MDDKGLELAVVMPVYNEEEIVPPAPHIVAAARDAVLFASCIVCNAAFV